ncbi:ASKHA domain-containing protein [uncultured Oscillibacter sp.]|uniref:ASKHA domain-containing protein n=1 Tax=uncultured Oscillibacter sp. TaxID=876091 RepID=UPI0025EDC0FD|nr:ASKHA domain-containing protein [uncultured Oscillibacter sp.]
MYSVTIHTRAGVVAAEAEENTLLSEVLRHHVPGFAMPCAGNHTCGKCRVRVRGRVSRPGREERALLGEAALGQGLRLACDCRVLGDVAVTPPAEEAGKVLAWYDVPPFRRTETGFGFAVDIGTTTVVVRLMERGSGKVAAERLAENAQRGFGADVISRIEACRTAGLDTLSARIGDQLEAMAAACLEEAGVDGVEESVVTGNTTMLHLYEGLDPSTLAVAPFAVQSHFGGRSRRTLAGKPVYLPRCVGAYVGADIVCAVLAAGLTGGGTQLLADIGTNGEIVLARDGRLICCATAAGPAFEGAGLSCGMPASAGAIRAVDWQEGRAVYETVDRRPAAGICGSGILDALAVMRRAEILEESGYLEAPWTIGDSGISIIQRDIRQIQLAKSAICAGIQTLLQTEGLTAADVDRFVIAGGFGSSLNQEAAVAVGLFPAALGPKTAFIGNGALGGAVMLLLNGALRRQAEALAAAAEELSLSESPVFMDRYLDAMTLAEAE